MVVGSIPAGGTIDVKRRSAERRFFVDAAPSSGGRFDPQSSLTFLKVRFAPLSARFGSSEPMLADACSTCIDWIWGGF